MQTPTQKLFVGNLSYDATEDQVRELFGQYGDVQEVKIVMDRFTGRSRGFAFVRMADADAAGRAKESLHGQALLGKSLVIDWARAEEKKPAGGGGFSRGPGGGGGGGDRFGGQREFRPRGERRDYPNDRRGGGYNR